jgi:hypothetical protein
VPPDRLSWPPNLERETRKQRGRVSASAVGGQSSRRAGGHDGAGSASKGWELPRSYFCGHHYCFRHKKTHPLFPPLRNDPHDKKPNKQQAPRSEPSTTKSRRERRPSPRRKNPPTTSRKKETLASLSFFPPRCTFYCSIFPNCSLFFSPPEVPESESGSSDEAGEEEASAFFSFQRKSASVRHQPPRETLLHNKTKPGRRSSS